MGSPNSWLSPDVMHALGWALVHSLWQCLAVAALAAVLMTFSRRPSVRYLVAMSALALMLAVPVATFFVLMRPAAPVPVLRSASPTSFVSAGRGGVYAPAAATVNAAPLATPSTAMDNGVMGALPRALPSMRDFPPNLLPWLVGAWFAGVAFFSLRFAGGFLLLEHKRRRQSIVPSPRIVAICQELQRQLGLDRAIRYLECSWLQAPAVIGWFRPIILLPVSALTGLSEEQLRAIVAHELAHIRRLDALVNLFQVLVETLLFYHPAMWWLNKRIRDERELCCDEIAVSLTGSRVEYARALTLMATWRNAPVLAMAANRGPLTERVLHILEREPFDARQRIMGLTSSALFLIAALGAANGLLGIAYPVPVAHAKERLIAALPSGQAVVDHAMQQIIQATTKNATPDRTSRNDAPHQETASADRTPSMQNGQPEKLVPPSFDLSKLLPHENPATPTAVALNAAPAAAPDDQPVASALLPVDPSALPTAKALPVPLTTPEDRPHGVHDPDALTCDAPQLVPVAKAVGWKICMQNSIVAMIGETGGLNLGGTLVKSFADLPISREPSGAGDPDAVTCLTRQGTGTRTPGPIACARNDFWAKLNATGCVLDPSARHIVPSGRKIVIDGLACGHIQGRNGVLPSMFF
jgi:beta-lactamase regulating signal transducer with metallopeptidase domain